MNGALGIILLVVLSHSIATAASYEIILQNGRSLQTSLYWKEDEEIRFFIYGGEMGLPLSAVKEIRRIPDRHQSSPRDSQQAPPSASSIKSPGNADAQQGDAAPEHPDLARRLQEETAAMANRSPLIPSMGRDQLLALAKEAEGLKKRIIKSPVAPHLNPSLLKLEELLERLEEELKRRS